jgi:hypothetical protein
VLSSNAGALTALINFPLWLFIIIFAFLNLNFGGKQAGGAPETSGAVKKLDETAAPRDVPQKTGQEALAASPARNTSIGAGPEKEFVTVTVNPVNGSGTFWNQGGSVLRLEAIGRIRRFYYVDPKGSAAKTGDMAFQGVREGLLFSGRAFLFSQRCAPVAYHVKGTLSPDGRIIKLQGKRPAIAAKCGAANFDGAELIFHSAGKL